MLKKIINIFRLDFWVGLESPQKGEIEKKKEKSFLYYAVLFFWELWLICTKNIQSWTLTSH